MNQKVLIHFEQMVNEKYFQFSFQPGVVTFDDLLGALDAFKVEVGILKEKEIEQQAKLKAEADAAKAGADTVIVDAQPE